MSVPTGAERSVVGAAAATWLGALFGLSVGPPAVVVTGMVAMVAMVATRRVVLIVPLVVAGSVSGALAGDRFETTIGTNIPEGPVEAIVRIVDEGPSTTPLRALADPVQIRRSGRWERWTGPALVVSTDATVTAGDLIRLDGRLRRDPGTLRGDPIAGRIATAEVEVLGTDAGVLLGAGNLLRARVRSVLGGREDAAAALLAGFLIGDTGGLSAGDVDALRRAGLVHFVAVSGSNVALFLAGWWLVAAPFSLRPRTRVVIGLIGLAVFVMATRWESSVLRAAVMAAAFLVGGIAGVPVTPWSALGAAITVLVLIAGQLAGDIGFQLSVAATAGILIGSGMFASRRPRFLWGTLGATIAAQAAVLPLLLFHFDTVPLMAPVANLVAAPLVSVATVLGGVAVATGFDWLVSAATIVSAAVLGIARIAAGWPQLGMAGAATVGVAALLARMRRLRPLVAVAGAAVVAVPMLATPGPPPVPTAVFLDVGQGDATLLRDPSGAMVLIDGGRDPVVLGDALRRYGVRRVDLLVATHGDVDHVGGFEGILDSVGVGRLWVPDQPELGSLLPQLIDEARARGVLVERPSPGVRIQVGALPIDVIGPQRRYLAENDGSIVLWVGTPRTLLLAGDIGAVAQRELPELDPAVLLVPHHGAGTTDPTWLERTVGATAIISVGPNTYGHPAPEILEVLHRSPVELHITEEEGDVTIPLVSESDPGRAERR